MGNVVRFAAVNTKIKSLEGKFLKDEDYLELLKKKSIPEMVLYLKEKTSYGKLLNSVKPEEANRRTLENALRRNMVKIIDKLLFYLNDEYRDFVKTLFLKYEIEDLKNLARDIYNVRTERTIENYSFIGKYSKADPERLIKARTIRDFILALEGSEIYDYLKPLLDGKRENLFRLEMALDTAYFTIIRRKWEKLSGEDKKVLSLWEGMVADLYNLQWIYRGKKFYNLSAEEILNYTIDFGYKINFKKRKEMCYAKDLNEVFNIAEKEGYGFLFKKDAQQDIYMERRINRFLYFKFKNLTRAAPLTIIQIVSYIWFLDFEIRDIISIAESLKYEIDLETAKKFLIRPL